MEEEKKKLTNEEILKLIAIVAVLLGILIYSIFSSNNGISKLINSRDNIDIEKMLEPIKNNYSLTIYKTSDNSSDTIEYITDGNLELYNTNDKENGYLIYKGKTYYVESSKTKIKEVTKKPDYINDKFTNIDFFKKVTKHCNIEDVKTSRFNCYIDISDYIDEYNNYYKTDYEYNGEEKVLFKIKHGTIVSNISVDYSEINKIINNGSMLTYDISIKKVNANDYSNLLEVFKDTLKK